MRTSDIREQAVHFYLTICKSVMCKGGGRRDPTDPNRKPILPASHFIAIQRWRISICESPLALVCCERYMVRPAFAAADSLRIRSCNDQPACSEPSNSVIHAFKRSNQICGVSAWT